MLNVHIKYTQFKNNNNNTRLLNAIAIAKAEPKNNMDE